MSDDLTQPESDLLRHLVHGTTTNADGSPMTAGPWMYECAKRLEAHGYVERAGKAFIATEAGREAVPAESTA
ncbi:hypothetical protein [Xanthobacter oligotrophicus]|uniref:hypothetical protein n=1 Tax=Xanthobacter oligotrophicus TaxID=2607286 RepID=UPI0011F3C94C|nr:hypothetical protein [Xanthobacter oligotrophicus]MCG5236628.1 hypothetical protein [Xanthobacter oligotrophicus]